MKEVILSQEETQFLFDWFIKSIEYIQIDRNEAKPEKIKMYDSISNKANIKKE